MKKKKQAKQNWLSLYTWLPCSACDGIDRRNGACVSGWDIVCNVCEDRGRVMVMTKTYPMRKTK